MVVGAVVDAAIGWLVQSILGNLFTEDLEAWTRRVGLGGDVKELKRNMGYVQMVLAAAKGRKIDSEPLLRSLADLREQLYDAEDVMDELDYYRLQEQVASGNSGSSPVADNTATSSMWSSTFRLGKRKRQDCHESEFSQRIKDIAGDLRNLGQDISDALKIDGSNFVGTSNLSLQNTRLTTSYVQHKVYGRDAEKESILNLIKDRSNALTVVPIVGIGGIGKTTLAQLVYSDSEVTKQFQIKIWICVSHNFNVTRLTKEMLDCVSKKMKTESVNLNKLQEDLEKHMASSSTLIVLDDVWDDMNQHGWDTLLSPLRRNQVMGNVLPGDIVPCQTPLLLNEKRTNEVQSQKVMGNVILVTTRKKSVAEMTQTVEPVELDDLKKDDFWKLFKSYAFGDEKYDECPRLYTIGNKIAQELRGNPLAAKTVGSLLRRNVGIDSWTNILNDEKWKSLQDSQGIMPALKLSYDYLPDKLQQCFRYCCLFPKDYHFDGEELVRMWISQGFVHGWHTGNKQDAVGKGYLEELVNSGFFQRLKSYGDSSTRVVMHDLMHDLACEVSKSEFTTVNGSESEEILPTVRHLSIVTDSACCLDNLVKWLLQVAPVRKLRSLVLIGTYKPSLLKCFQNMFKGAENLRLLQTSAAYADFVPFLSDLVNCAHLRYLKLKKTVSGKPLSINLSKFYHLEVLDARHPTIVHGMNDLVSMRYLLIAKGAHSSITNCSQLAHLRFVNKLVQLGVFQLQNVGTEEACGIKMRDKLQLERLHLSWKDDYDTFSESEDESLEDDNDIGSYMDSEIQEGSLQTMNNTASERSISVETEQSSGPMNDSISNPSSETFIDAETDFEVSTDARTELERPPTNDSNINPTSEHLADTRDVLECLEPHRNLKQLWVSGYSGATSPAWLGTSLTCLQQLHLEDCKELQALPSLEGFPFLTKLRLRNMPKVTQVSIPPLEELVLIEMRKLERCFCNSTRDLNSSLRVLMIQRCDVLKAFPLFESCEKLRIEHKSWLSGLSNLTVHDCPELIVSNPLPPSSSTCKLSISRVSTLPTMKGLSNGELIFGTTVNNEVIDEDSNELRKLDSKILAFHNLRFLTHLKIAGCKNLSFVSLEGFKQLVSLNSLDILDCGEFFSSDVLPEHALEEMETANFNAFPTLKHLRILSAGYYRNKISGKWLSVMLRHVPVLEELHLEFCGEISGLLLEGKENCLSNHNSSPHASSLGNPDNAPTSSTREGLVHIPSNLVSSLKKLSISRCYGLSYMEKKASFSAFTSLEELTIRGCDGLMSSFEPKEENSDHANGGCLLPYSPSEPGSVEPEPLEKVQLCPWMSANSLKKLQVSFNEDLESLQLDSYTTLEELSIENFGSLITLEGLQCLRGLRYLELFRCPHLPPFMEHLSGQVSELFPRLERLRVDDYSFLTTSFCKHLASLRCLHLSTGYHQVQGLTGEQDSALQLIKTLQDLEFYNCLLVDLPVGLHSLSSLKRLRIIDCPRILRLPENGLPPSLEELEIWGCSEELKGQCRALATRMLKVKIDYLGSRFSKFISLVQSSRRP